MHTEIENILTHKAGEIYLTLLDSMTYGSPSQFVKIAYSKYQQDFPSRPSLNGLIFEFLICEALVREGITPFYYQARFAHVPNADFDIVLYHPYRPVALSAKTSLRERYKQADLEGLALRQVYRNAESHLLTMDDEYMNVQDKIKSGDVAGLSSCIRADRADFNSLLKTLKGRKFELALPINPLEGTPVPST